MANPQSPFCSVVAAATACRFEPTGQFEDEATLVRLLELLGNCVRGPAGALLTDAHVWDAAQCCFRIASMERCSHLLQRTSQSALTQAVLHVFSRLHELLEAEGAAAAAAAAAAAPVGGSAGGVAVAAGHMRRHAPYGVGVLARLMAWLAGLVEPRAHPRATRVMALEVLNIVLETGGDALGRVPRIVGVCQGDLCRNLIQVGGARWWWGQCQWWSVGDPSSSRAVTALRRWRSSRARRICPSSRLRCASSSTCSRTSRCVAFMRLDRCIH